MFAALGVTFDEAVHDFVHGQRAVGRQGVAHGHFDPSNGTVTQNSVLECIVVVFERSVRYVGVSFSNPNQICTS
jgi:hypothetical protein